MRQGATVKLDFLDLCVIANGTGLALASAGRFPNRIRWSPKVVAQE